ncbi:MAG: zinc ribbon domain-containing protein [Candidatus Omnitrophica bacterium]|nr:zinc ribbon domain-containing protein [Candidatus Omnitrophota bacterium]
MPTYEYKCLKCKKTFEKFQPMTDKPLRACVHCKGKVERLIGAGSGLIFKGAGFYVTDYKKSSPSPAKDKESKKDPPKK